MFQSTQQQCSKSLRIIFTCRGFSTTHVPSICFSHGVRDATTSVAPSELKTKPTSQSPSNQSSAGGRPLIRYYANVSELPANLRPKELNEAEVEAVNSGGASLLDKQRWTWFTKTERKSTKQQRSTEN